MLRFAAVLVSTMLWATAAIAVPDLPECEPPDPAGEVEIRLLTMAPGGQVWNVFGHNGIWVRQHGLPDRIYNFGVISDEHPDMLQRFVAGTLDFFLGTRSYDNMLSYYTRQERTIVVQTLDLPPLAARRVAEVLSEEALPENRSYRYHWIEANCATRVRDVLNEALSEQLLPQHQGVSPYTARGEVLRHLGPHEPLWFAWHFAVGGSADAPLSRWDLMFMPDRLYEAIDESFVEESDGSRRPLVSHSCRLREGKHGWAPKGPPQRDLILWGLGLVMGVLFLGLARASRRFRLARLGAALFVAVFGLIAGGLGTLSAWAWLTSVYVGFSWNANLLVANPLTLLLVPAAVVILFRVRALARPLRWVSWTLLGLGAVGLVVAALPSIPQPTVGHAGVFLPVLVVVAMESGRLVKSS